MGGIPLEVIAELRAAGGLATPDNPPECLTFDPEALKLTADRMLRRAGVRVLYHLFATAVEREGAGIGSVIAALKLVSPNQAVRLAAARELQSSAEPSLLPAITKALAKESDAEVKNILVLTEASIQLSAGDKPARMAAIAALAASNNPNTKTLLIGSLAKKGNEFAEPDADIRAGT